MLEIKEKHLNKGKLLMSAIFCYLFSTMELNFYFENLNVKCHKS